MHPASASAMASRAAGNQCEVAATNTVGFIVVRIPRN
jgi:hypothetical protein